MTQTIVSTSEYNFLPAYLLKAYSRMYETLEKEQEEHSSPFVTSKQASFSNQVESLKLAAELALSQENPGKKPLDLSKIYSSDLMKNTQILKKINFWGFISKKLTPIGSASLISSELEVKLKSLDQMQARQSISNAPSVLHSLQKMIANTPLPGNRFVVYPPCSEESINTFFLNIKFVLATFQKFNVPIIGNNLEVLTHYPKMFLGRSIVSYLENGKIVNRIDVGYWDKSVMLSQELICHLDFASQTLGQIAVEHIGVQKKIKGFFGKTVEGIALRNHLVDVLTIIVKHAKQFNNKETEYSQFESNATWNIGENLFCSPNKEGAFHLRSMKDPGTAHTKDYFPQEEIQVDNSDFGLLKNIKLKLLQGCDPQVSNMSDYVLLKAEEESSYVLFGVLNRAFYLTSKHLQTPSWGVPFDIWSNAIKNTESNSSIREFANQTLMVAKNLFSEQEMRWVPAIYKAWEEVGIDLDRDALGNSLIPCCGKFAPFIKGLIFDQINSIELDAILFINESEVALNDNSEILKNIKLKNTTRIDYSSIFVEKSCPWKYYPKERLETFSPQDKHQLVNDCENKKYDASVENKNGDLCLILSQRGYFWGK